MLGKSYAWLLSETGPAILLSAVELCQSHGEPGALHEAQIQEWFSEIGLERQYNRDPIQSAALVVAIAAYRAGQKLPQTRPSEAKSWQGFGKRSIEPKLGDILVWRRSLVAADVGIYIGEDPDSFHIISADAANAVSVRREQRGDLIAIRRCDYGPEIPSFVRVVRLFSDGQIA